MIENFQNNPPQQQLMVEEIGTIKKSDDGKQYEQKQTIAEYDRLPKSINYNNLGPNIYAVYETNDGCNGDRYILYYNEETDEFFYFDKQSGLIVGYDSENEAKDRKTAEERAKERKYLDITNIDLQDVEDVKTSIMNELSYDEQLEKLDNAPLEKLKRAFIEADDDLDENVILSMKKKLDENKFNTSKETQSYFDKEEIRRLNELSNSELTDEQLKLDCPKREQKKCKNGFKIMYDLPERFGKSCPYMVCNDTTFLQKYKKGILILIILCLLVIVILMAI